MGLEIAARVGIHLGEVHLRRNAPRDVARGAKPLEVEGLAKPTAARLMALAGYPEARGTRWRGCLERSAESSGPRRPTRARYLHSCTVCDFHRTARRPMHAWRCAACVAAGLSGELQITRKEASR